MEPAPQQQQPRRSTRICTPTKKTTQDQQIKTRLEKAVKELKEAREQIRETRADRRRLIEELQQAVPRGDDDVNVGPDEIDRVLAMLDTIKDTHTPNSGTDTDPDAPKTLDEAQKSADWLRWEKLYRDELDSLEKMG
ncbi:hypothetical protein C0995_001058, partial [Termitomyces sp. Mi166